MAYIGSAPSVVTSIADGTIVNADINASAAIATSKITGLATSATQTLVIFLVVLYLLVDIRTLIQLMLWVTEG